MQFQNTSDFYNFADITTYAHGVKPDLDLLVYYPATSVDNSTSVDTGSESEFVTQMHTLNMTVHAYALRGDVGMQYGLNDVLLTKMVTVKGVDGVYTDFASATQRAVTLIGS